MNANIKFELKAYAFNLMTNMLAPGKDAREGPSRHERENAWDKWNVDNKIIINSMIHAIEHIYGEDRSDIRCPFCDSDDFDLIGLKIHLTQNHCDKYREII